MTEFQKNIGYCSYSTIFSAEGKRTVRKNRYACFAEVLNRGVTLQKENYEIFLFTDITPITKCNMSNYCLLTKEQLINHIHQARRLFPFKYKVEETMVEYSTIEYLGYKVSIELDMPHIYHKYLLTWIRYAYEYPFNVLLNDVYKLKKEYFTKENIPNLFALVANCYPSGNYNTGHAITPYSRFWDYIIVTLLKEPTLKSSISKVARVNEIYPYKTLKEKPFFVIPSTGIQYLEYWLDDNYFRDRVEYYTTAYKVLKKTKI